MDYKLLGIITTVIILIIIIIYYSQDYESVTHLDYWKTHYTESPDQIYERSAGVFDNAAKLALKRSLDPPHKSNKVLNHNRAANIIYRNILLQEPTTPTFDHFRQLAQDEYLASLINLSDDEIINDEVNRANRRANNTPRDDNTPPRGEIQDHPGAEFIIDEAMDFAITMGEEYPHNEIIEVAQNRRNTTTQSRQNTAKEIAEQIPGTQADVYLDLSQRNTSDSQNSHDPSINAAKKSIIDRLRSDQSKSNKYSTITLDTIINEINKNSNEFSRDPRTNKPRPVLTGKAVKVIERAKNGERSLSADATDEEVFKRVWLRADDDRNKKNHNLLKQSFYDSLVDCYERGIGKDTIQCVDGRISRILGSLVLLDFDERNWNMKRLEQYKNDIFEKSAKVIKESAKEAADQNEDEELKRVGQSYLATSGAELSKIGEVNEEKEKEWIESTRSRISSMIDNYVEKQTADSSQSIIPKHSIESIKQEACLALEN